MVGEFTEKGTKKRAFLPGKEERILTNNILGGTNGEMITILTVKKDAGNPCNMEDKTRKDNGKDAKNPMEDIDNYGQNKTNIEHKTANV